MAEIVGALGVSHVPSGMGQYARYGSACETVRLYNEVRKHLDAVDPDVLVFLGPDHFLHFFFDNMPTFAVGVADRTSGPGTDDGWEGHVEFPDIPVDLELAKHIHETGITDGFDLAQTQEFEVCHTVTVPLFFLTPDRRRPIIPFWVNGFAHPLPLAKRCFSLGGMLREAIASWPADIRVGLIASGAISDDIGGPRALHHAMGAAGNRDWVELVERRIVKGEVDELMNDASPSRIRNDGNATGEFLSWTALLGVAGERKPVFYESEYRRDDSGASYCTGMAFAAWRWDL